MIVTIHQPEHLPWLGFFAKAASADELILLDTVPYRHHYFQNRNRVLFNGEPEWLTVPVRHRDHLAGTIAAIEIEDQRPWKRKYTGRLRDAYRRAPHGATVTEPLVELIDGDETSIADLNTRIIAWLAQLLGVDVAVRRASQMNARGESSELLAGLCAEAGASAYLSGPSGREYLEHAPFERRRVEVRYFGFTHPEYPQPVEPFVPRLSAIDLIANVGAEAAAEVLAEAVANSVSES
jgi:hypothetical protein